MNSTDREALERFREKLYSARRCQEQDVVVNGAAHPGLLEPMQSILRRLCDDYENLEAALSRPSPSGEDVERIIQTVIDTKARELGVVLLPKPCQKITKAVIAALSLPHKNGEVDRG